MKPRTAQLGARKNPDSPRVHGLRFSANPSSLKSEELPGNAEQKTGSPPTESSTEVTEAQQAVEPLLDCSAAADVLGGLHPKTVERWAREGRIPAYRYFRHWRFRVSDLEIWMRSHVQSACHPCRLNQEKSDGT
ncbi:MAG: helix-turn-helix domain-containing protein [Candidatus Acidiferrales bacterium]